MRLTSAEQFERETPLLSAQVSAMRRVGGPRSGLRLSYLPRTITRALKSRDRCLAEAVAALSAVPSEP